MFTKAFGALLAVAVPLASASLHDNLAYRSPSLHPNLVEHRALTHDLEFIQLSKRWNYYDGHLDFPYGVASGDPYSDSIILWTHPVASGNGTSKPEKICLNYVVAAKNDSYSFKHSVASGQVFTTSEVDYSVKVEAKGLKAYSTYFYRFENCAAEGNVSPVGRFKTKPSDDADIDSIGQLRFAVYSCSNYPFGFFNAFGNPARKDSVDYVLHLGDYIYEYKNGDYGNGTSIGRVPLPDREISTLDDYRQRYATYRTDEDLKLSHQMFAWDLIWDDHEVADNTWKSGSADSNDTLAGEINGVAFTSRKANAVKAYYEWMPIRQVATDEKLRIWRSFKYGQLADLIMLDTRQYDRDITDTYDNTRFVYNISNTEARSLMGERQESWFYDQLKESKKRQAKWRLIGQQIVFSQLNYSAAEPDYLYDADAWDGYKANRRRVLDVISENKIDNVVILSGDSHANWVFDVKYDNESGYNPQTGEGALAVEFGGTAVSSPTPFGRGKPDQFYTNFSTILTSTNPELKWSEGQYRGYFELYVSKDNATASYFALPDILTRNGNETRSATFVVKDGANKIQRPVAGGHVAHGALQRGLGQ